MRPPRVASLSIFSTARRRRQRSRARAAAHKIPVGRITGLFGIHGELKCDSTSAGRAVFLAGAELTSTRDGDSWPVRIKDVRSHRQRLLLRLEGVDDTAAAAAYIGSVLYAAREQIVLERGEYLDEDLIGCAVDNAEGARYGTVERIEHYPSSDMLVVEGRMVPLVAAIVTQIDLVNRRIVIDPPGGLME